MKLNFTKMHGIGNDYIYFNCLDSELENPSETAIKLSPRHTSVGADGIVMICKSDVADAKMRMFNADGSEGKMCGNAIRCVGKYLYDRGITNKTELKIETLSGIKILSLSVKDGTVESVRVDMGYADFSPKAVNLDSDDEHIDRELEVDGKIYKITALSVGNPHAVVYVDDPDVLDLEKLGPKFENHPLFKDKVNTEFVQKISDTELKMRVWERGSGETYACGTGACATVASSVKNGLVKAGAPITVSLIGGKLTIECTPDYKIFMTGSAEFVYDGTTL